MLKSSPPVNFSLWYCLYSDCLFACSVLLVCGIICFRCCCFVCVCFCYLFTVSFSHFQHTQVIVSFGMVVVGGQRQTKTLVRQIHVTDTLKRPTNNLSYMNSEVSSGPLMASPTSRGRGSQAAAQELETMKYLGEVENSRATCLPFNIFSLQSTAVEFHFILQSQFSSAP